MLGRDFALRRGVLRSLALMLAAEAAGAATASDAGSMPRAKLTGFLAIFGDLKLRDQDGRALDLTQSVGRMMLFNFILADCPNVCPLQTRWLADLQYQLSPRLRARLQLVSVSVDPLHDTPQVLKAFAVRMGADRSGWSCHTGRPQEIERLAETLKLFRPGSDARKPAEHDTTLWLTDAMGELRMRYGVNPPDIRHLRRDIAALDTLKASRDRGSAPAR